MNDDGTLNENAKPYTGIDRLEAREEIIKFLKEKKLFIGQKDHAYPLSICQRSDDVIEPRIKPQWYCECKDLAEKSIDLVKKGDLKILPKFYEDKWFDWLGNIKEWCISRQLWWGHRIPAYFINIIGKETSKDTIDEKYWVCC